ncbi:MAG: hypothetical protein JWR58_5103 [Pseudonocardia sp.]|nr:hypothetical protein [Pseudonocardia sp.]
MFVAVPVAHLPDVALARARVEHGVSLLPKALNGRRQLTQFDRAALPPSALRYVGAAVQCPRPVSRLAWVPSYWTPSSVHGVSRAESRCCASSAWVNTGVWMLGGMPAPS